MGTYVGIITVDYMDFSFTYTWCSFHTTFIEPTVGNGGVQVSNVLSILVATSDKQWESVVVGTTLTIRPEWKQITETTPGDTDVVGSCLDVQTSVHTVNEVAVVNPHVLTGYQLHIVSRGIVEGTRTLHHDVTDDHVLTLLKVENARGILICSVNAIV